MRKTPGWMLILVYIFISSKAYADPWFTGPLLASSGKTIPLGHCNLEIYAFYTDSHYAFDNDWQRIPSTPLYNTQFNPVLSYGLASWMDFQFSLPYVINHSQHVTGRHIGDTAATLGFQVLEQKESRWRPNLRVSVQQIFPTGRFDDLNPTNAGTDGSGVGSYQTTIGFNFQHLAYVNNHYLRTRLNLDYLWANPVSIRGLSSYGGNETTRGQAKPGNLIAVDLAGELALTQNWVAVLEGYYFSRQPMTFVGFAGFDIENTPLIIAQGYTALISLAPAIEYNFSSNYGLIAGAWFAVLGKNTIDFVTPVIAFNAFW